MSLMLQGMPRPGTMPGQATENGTIFDQTHVKGRPYQSTSDARLQRTSQSLIQTLNGFDWAGDKRAGFRKLFIDVVKATQTSFVLTNVRIANPKAVKQKPRATHGELFTPRASRERKPPATGQAMSDAHTRGQGQADFIYPGHVSQPSAKPQLLY